MKQFFIKLAVLLAAVFLIAQVMWTSRAWVQPVKIIDAVTLNSGGTASTTSDGFAIQNVHGAIVLYVDQASTGSDGTNGTLVLEYEIYNSRDQKWYHHYTDADAETDLVTIPLAKADSDVYVLMSRDGLSTFGPADSMRVTATASDTSLVTMWAGGQ
jgi:hypothetical protein